MYNTDAMIIVKLNETSWRKWHFDENDNSSSLRDELELIREIHEARVREVVVKGRIARRYNTRIRERPLHKGDLVWRKLGESRKGKCKGKLVAN